RDWSSDVCSSDLHVERWQPADQPIHRLPVGDVQLRDVDAAEHRVVAGRRELLLREAARDHLGARAEEGKRDGAADAGHAAGHEDALAAEVEAEVHGGDPGLRRSAPLEEESPGVVRFELADELVAGLAREGLEVPARARIRGGDLQHLAARDGGQRLLRLQDRQWAVQPAGVHGAVEGDVVDRSHIRCAGWSEGPRGLAQLSLYPAPERSWPTTPTPSMPPTAQNSRPTPKA